MSSSGNCQNSCEFGQNGNAENGKELFIVLCGSCHTTEECDKHKLGPNLFGMFGRKIGSAPGYIYSGGMGHSKVLWSKEALNEYLKDPGRALPGSNLTEQHKVKEHRTDILAYLLQATEVKKEE